jgi:transcriptional regulator with XRE-family HTH domain
MAKLHLVHCAQALEINKKPSHASSAPALALVTTAAYPPAASSPPNHQVMARPHSAPYLETDPPGATIHRLRTQRGWSQADLARHCRPPLDASAISRLEHNEGFTQDSLERVAAALGMPYQALFYPPELATYGRLPPEIRKRLADTIADAAAAYETRNPKR